MCYDSPNHNIIYRCCRDGNDCCSDISSVNVPNPDSNQISIFGCPINSPYRCFDGSCETSFSKCVSGGKCPDGMYLCSSGLCSNSSSFCPDVDLFQCGNGNGCSNILRPVCCGNGRCEHSSSECEIIRPCGENEERCSNGECRPKSSTSLCPSNPSNPSNSINICLENICRNGPLSGMCFSDTNRCILGNGITHIL